MDSDWSSETMNKGFSTVRSSILSNGPSNRIASTLIATDRNTNNVVRSATEYSDFDLNRYNIQAYPSPSIMQRGTNQVG